MYEKVRVLSDYWTLQIEATARKMMFPAKELSTFLKFYSMKRKGKSWAFVIKKVLRTHMHFANLAW